MDTVENSKLQNNQNVPPKQNARTDSYFDGNTWQLICYRILSILVNTITLGIAYPWMLCMMQRWETKHTVINGRRLKFNGKGVQLIGKWILWIFLTIITFGIYGIWLGLGMKKWVVKHTVYADEERPVDSYFSGGAGGFLGIHLLSFVLTVFTLGIGKAWADKMVLCWEAKHTHIGGSPLEFNGKGGQLLVKYILLALLTPLTLGIYALFFPVIYIKWQTKNTVAVYQKPEIQAEARSHEFVAVQDYAKYRIAANDTEIAMLKSGYTGKETTEELEALTAEGNPYACYRLATQMKADTPVYENRALELLQIAANANYYPAQFDLAQQLPKEQAIPMLEDAARNGSSVAPWLLATHYNQSGSLKETAYWFKVALEWGDSNAITQKNNYDVIIKNIALQLSEKQQQTKSNSTLPIVLGVVGGIVALVLVGGFLMAIFGLRFGNAAEKAPAQNEQLADLDTKVEETGIVHIGDYVYFGTYEQDNNTSNGKEAIEWLVLDKQGDSVLLISKYALDCQPYHEELTDITWETCSLRSWLNNTFINNAFSTEEQARIETTKVSADKNPNFINSIDPGNATQDRVFLLSVTEVYNYFESNDERKCGTTEYAAQAQNVYTSDSHSADGKATCYWWLRTPGDSQNIATRGGIDGHIVHVGNGVNADRHGVRPALRITLQGDEILHGDKIYLSDATQLDDTENQGNDTQNNYVQNTKAPTTTETPTENIADYILGEWVFYDMLTNMTTGEDTLEIWTFTFNSDGTYSFIHNECMVSVEGTIYYGDRCWAVMLGYGEDGTYSISGDELSVQYYLDGENAVLTTTDYTVELHENILSIYCDGWNRTRDFERK